MQTIAIIGAGFSGTLVAVHLLRQGCGVPTTIVMIERTGRFTAGVAYGTCCTQHLLNVPAGRMSAFDDDAGHFLRWAKLHDPTVGGGTFVPRRMYGEYLAHVLNNAEAHAAPDMRLLRVPAQALSMRSGPDCFSIDLGGGGIVRADKVVLAIGNFPPANPTAADMAFYRSAHYARDPWAADSLEVPSDDAVLLIGTGLTMMDIALALRERGHRAPIHAISRRGLLPQPHRDSAVPPAQHERPAELENWPRTALGLLRSLRREVRTAAQQGVDWREVVTSIRHDTPALWESLSFDERRRFLVHLRPFWETHRHRAAPSVASSIDSMIHSQHLRVIGGRIVRFDQHSKGVKIAYCCRSTGEVKSISVGRVINCTGPDTNLARVDEPLIVSLRQAGLIRPDALGLGLDCTAEGAIIRANGRPCSRLWLVGPLRKGQLWENTAVPELRIEAANLAGRLCDNGTPALAASAMDAGHVMQC